MILNYHCVECFKDFAVTAGPEVERQLQELGLDPTKIRNVVCATCRRQYAEAKAAPVKSKHQEPKEKWYQRQ